MGSYGNQKMGKSTTMIGVDTARGRRMVSVEDLGLAIDALASRLSEVEEMLGSGALPLKDDLTDAELLLRINPDYAGICNPIIAAYEAAEEGE